jgi:hypothetical protein
MNKDIQEIHLKVGSILGENRTCGKKINYFTEEKAAQAAEKMNRKESTRNILEAYPCVFCSGWHIGRKMSVEELMSYLNDSL